jgi:3,4-dihydroxy 2-butanone 4-phosphate synthase/GTP cyclohydrolase II
MSEIGAYGTLVHLGDRRLTTEYGGFRLHRFRNLATRRLALAAVIGDVAAPQTLVARVHSSCVTSEAYAGCDCDCAEQLRMALDAIARARRGVVFYLVQEGRGAGFAAKARDRMLVQASRHRLTTFEAYERMGLGKDHRRYDEVGAMCRLLGISAPLRLLTNNPDKVAALEDEGIAIESVLPLENEPSAFNVHYISAKQRSGHLLGSARAARSAADLPEPVEEFSPYALPEMPHVVHIASYLLPIRFAEETPDWFRLHAYVDGASGVEHVVLTHRGHSAPLPIACVERERLEDRFPSRDSIAARRRWRQAVSAIRANGAGCALFESVEEVEGSPDPIGLAILARHAAVA